MDVASEVTVREIKGAHAGGKQFASSQNYLYHKARAG